MPWLPFADAARLGGEHSLRVMLEFLDEQIALIPNTKKKRSLTLKLKAMVNMVRVKHPSLHCSCKGCADCVGFTPLMYAIHYRNTNCAKLLLKYGADPNVGVGTFMSLSELVTDRVKKYFRRMKYINDPMHDFLMKSINTPLYRAVAKRHFEMVHLLLENGAMVVPGCMNRSVQEGDFVICEALIRHGDDVNEKIECKYGGSRPIEEACSGRNVKVVELLLAIGAKIERDWSGKYQESPFEKIPILPQYYKDIMSGNEQDRYYADKYRQDIFEFKEIVRLLLEYGADPLELVSRPQVMRHTGESLEGLSHTDEEYERTVPVVEFYRLIEHTAVTLPGVPFAIKAVYRHMIHRHCYVG